MKRLKDKIAVITGAAGSLGKQTAKAFLREGAKLFLVDLNEDVLKETVDELGGENIEYCVADISKPIDVQIYVAKIVRAYGKIDVFFNNVDNIEDKTKLIDDYSKDEIAVKVRSIWLGTEYILSEMNDGGSMIISASVAGLNGSQAVSAYIKSKYIITGVMRVTAMKAAVRNIRVNSIHPSPFDKLMMRSLENRFAADSSKEAIKELEKKIPLSHYPEMTEIAKAVLFLASNDSQFTTGTPVVVDGGSGVL